MTWNDGMQMVDILSRPNVLKYLGIPPSKRVCTNKATFL